MKRERLTERFIEDLNRHIPHRPELVREVSRILKIEKEPASRRISGNVSFSIDEMGILAKEFNLSIDALMYSDENLLKTPIILEYPWSQNSMDSFLDGMIQNLIKINRISNKPYEMGTVFNSLPIDILLHYPNLAKFIFFKWGHFFVESSEFNDFASWNIPEKMLELKNQVELFNQKPGKRLYIWDVSLIWGFVKDMKYLYDMDIVNVDDINTLKEELHSMLTRFERYIKNIDNLGYSEIDTSFYISNVAIGVTGLYVKSEIGQLAFSNTHFSRTGFSIDEKSVDAIKRWMMSLMKISTLITHSGYKERHLFFKDQHQTIDFVLD